MKKLLALLLAFVILASVLASCGGADTPAEIPSDSSAPAASETDKAPASSENAEDSVPESTSPAPTETLSEYELAGLP